MQRMFRQTDQTDQNGWLVGIVCALYVEKKKIRNLKSSPSIDRSISPTPIPSEKVCPSPHPHYPSHPIRSDHPPHDTYPSAGESSTYIQFFQCMQVAACIDEIRSETTACAVPSSYTDRQTDRQVCILFTEAVCVCVWLRSSFFSSCA